MPYLLIEGNRAKSLAADCGKYTYLALELVGDELSAVQLRLHGTRMVGENHLEVVHWDDQKVYKNSYVTVSLVEKAFPTEPATTSVSQISVEAIQRDLDDLGRQLAKIRKPSVPHVRQISGALKFHVGTPKFPELSLCTDKEQYLQVNGVWSGEESVLAINGRSFSADRNGHPHSFRTWFTDVLSIGDKARIEVESAI